MDSSYVVSYCSPTRYCPFPVPLFFVPAPRAYCTGAYCHVHVYRTVPLLPGDLSFDLLSPGKPSCISLCTYFAQYIHLSPVLSVELCSSLYCSQSAGAPACLTLSSPSSLDSSRNTRSKLPYRHQRHNHLLPRLSLPHIFLSHPWRIGAMAATQPLDSRILSQLIPREYNGKSAQEGRRFLTHTRLYLDQMDIAKIASAISWIIALNHLTVTNPFFDAVGSGTSPGPGISRRDLPGRGSVDEWHARPTPLPRTTPRYQDPGRPIGRRAPSPGLRRRDRWRRSRRRAASCRTAVA